MTTGPVLLLLALTASAEPDLMKERCTPKLAASQETAQFDTSPRTDLVREGPSQIVYSDDGLTYAHTLSPEHLPDGPVVDGAITWEYQGQQRFSTAPVTNRGPQCVCNKRIPGSTPYQDIMDTSRVDNLGRLWHPIALNEEIACERARPDLAEGLPGKPQKCNLHRRSPAIPASCSWWTPM